MTKCFPILFMSSYNSVQMSHFLQNRGIVFSVIDVFYVFDGNLPFSIPLHIPFVQYDGILGSSCHGSHKLYSLLIIALTFHHRVLVLSVPRITSPPSVA